MAMHISIFHTANNQTSDHYLISIYYSHITDCRPVQSQTFLEFNSYQKYSICGHNLRTLMTAYKHRSLQLGRERATVLIAIKITRDSFYKTGSTEHNANNKFNPLLLNNSPLNPKERRLPYIPNTQQYVTVCRMFNIRAFKSHGSTAA